MTGMSALKRRFGKTKAGPSVPAPAAPTPVGVANCIPLLNKAGTAFVLGLKWRAHLTKESIKTEIGNQAKQGGFTHSFVPRKGVGAAFGLAKIERADASKYKTLVPLSVAFAQCVQDPSSISIFVLELKDDATQSSIIFMASATRGAPSEEIVVRTHADALARISAWAGQTRAGCSIYMDTTDEEFYRNVSGIYPSTTELLLSSINRGLTDGMTAIKIQRLKTWHFVLVGAGVIGWLGWTVGQEAYQSHLQQISQEEAKKAAIRNYIAARDAGFSAGYTSSVDDGLKSILSELKAMPLIRNGWAFTHAECTITQAGCDITWTRLYGTYETFLESAAPSTLTLDPADYRTLKERRTFTPPVVARPAPDKLQAYGDFIKRNGDRADTFQLAGISEYKVSPLKPLVEWHGTGVPPGPVLSLATWTMTAMPDQILEASTNHRITKEFALEKVRMTLDKTNQVIITVEGNVYVQQQ